MSRVYRHSALWLGSMPGLIASLIALMCASSRPARSAVRFNP
jgi:hypothetical protein